MIKILIADDSETDVLLLKHVIAQAKDMTVIAVAKNGKEAVELTARLKPDLVIMDIYMPIMDGLQATWQIVSHCPTPIVVISSTVTDESLQATFHILEAGALCALPKPRAFLSSISKTEQENLIDTIRSMAQVKVVKRTIVPASLRRNKSSFSALQHLTYELVAIGVSVGGPMALKTILSKLPASFPIPIVIVQHISYGFGKGYAKWLNDFTPLAVKNTEHLERLNPGTVYIAPDGYHLEVERIDGKLHGKLSQNAAVDGFRPSITVLLNSVAKTCGKQAIAMLLTGMGKDGAQGLLAVRQAKGHTLIQDPASAVVFGMAEVAQSLGAVDKVVNLDEIADYLLEITLER